MCHVSDRHTRQRQRCVTCSGQIDKIETERERCVACSGQTDKAETQRQRCAICSGQIDTEKGASRVAVRQTERRMCHV